MDKFIDIVQNITDFLNNTASEDIQTMAGLYMCANFFKFLWLQHEIAYDVKSKKNVVMLTIAITLALIINTLIVNLIDICIYTVYPHYDIISMTGSILFLTAFPFLLCYYDD